MSTGDYCIPHRHKFIGQTTKQPLSNFELQKPWKYQQFQGLRPDPSCFKKISVNVSFTATAWSYRQILADGFSGVVGQSTSVANTDDSKTRNLAAYLISNVGPGRFAGIAGNAGNHGNTRKFHESDQALYQIKREINKLCLGKISLQKTVRMKLSVDSGFSNVFYCKNENLEMPEFNRKLPK